VPAAVAMRDEVNDDVDDDVDEGDDHRTWRLVLAHCNLSRRRQLPRHPRLPRKNCLRLWNSVVSGAMEDIVLEDAGCFRARTLTDTCCQNPLARTCIAPASR